jgi:hypothetical protein
MQIQSLCVATCCLALAACGSGSESAENALCSDEISRKVQGSDMTIESVEFTARTKDNEGNDILNGNVDIVQGGNRKTHQFSCVMEGSGADAVVMRADFQ